MKIQYELKDITLSENKIHDNNSYPGVGVYNVNNGQTIVFVYNYGLYTFVVPYNEISFLIQEDEVVTVEHKPEKTVSEEFALKAMALVINKEKLSDLIL